MKIGIISLGCSKNLMDTHKAMLFLTRHGHTFTQDISESEAIIINTCAFINDAKEESINAILDAADYKKGKCRRLIVMGCLAQRYVKDLEQSIPEVDRFITIDEYKDLESILTSLLGTVETRECEYISDSHPWTAYLRISDGCNNRCAFCAIPLIRGKYRSVEMDELLKQAEIMQKAGVRELNLIAQDSSKYGIDIYGKPKLYELLKELNKMDFHWIRVLYLYPDELSDEVLENISKLDKVLPYYDIPVQHASNRLLKAMRRASSRESIERIVNKIREFNEDPTLRTTVIVGFPTEKKEDFNQLMDFVSRTKWDHLGAFRYSREENTEAYSMKPQVAKKTSQNRYDRLMKLQKQISLESGERYLDSIQEVLVEQKDALRNIYIGRSAHHAPDDIDGHVVFTSNETLLPGSFVKVRITAVNAYDWKGEALNG